MLGQTEIERIADEILSELQAGDRTVVLEEADSVSWLRMKVVTRVTDTRPFFRILTERRIFFVLRFPFTPVL